MQDEFFDLEKAMSSNVSLKWMHAVEEEMDLLKKNQTWELVPLLQGSRIIGCKWTYKVKDGI